MNPKKKKPKIAVSVKGGKNPANLPLKEPDRHSPIVWKLNLIVCDPKRKWNWCECGENSKYLFILKKLGELEQLSFHELNQSAPHHFVKIDKIVKKVPKVSKELEILQLDDELSLFSLKISPRERIWCKAFGNQLSIVWYDPNHEICPSIR
ncbi:MAG: hypothetical protein P9M05_09150 [Candidatus Stygibacter australis]|nr:hypothetical protein [Candidatus Stygibacter australis]